MMFSKRINMKKVITHVYLLCAGIFAHTTVLMAPRAVSAAGLMTPINHFRILPTRTRRINDVAEVKRLDVPGQTNEVVFEFGIAPSQATQQALTPSATLFGGGTEVGEDVFTEFR